MEFTVPQFIEREAKIVGPFTFKQFIFVGTAGGICLFLYFFLPLSAFIIIAVILLGGAFALAFLRIGKISLPVYIKNFFIFLFKPKIYLWQKKGISPKVFKREEKIIKEEVHPVKSSKRGISPKAKLFNRVKEEPALKVARGSKLNDLFTRLGTK